MSRSPKWRRTKRLAGIILAASAGLSAAHPAAASEIRYQYDALGRLVQVVQSGAAAYEARYGYDKADNRLSRIVTGAGTAAVIVPLVGGYRVIPVRRE